MKAIILAAGMASRMRPLTNDIPKCLLKLGSFTILERTIINLISYNITEFTIVTGFLHEKIHEFVKNKFPNLRFTFIHNELYQSTNNIYSLWLTKDAAKHDQFFLLDSDIVFDKRVLELLISSPYENCLAVRSSLDLAQEEMKISTHPDQSVSEISKEIDPAKAVGESIGIEKFSQEFVNELFQILDIMILNDKNVNIFYEAAFQKAIHKGLKIFPVNVGDLKCMEIDTIEDLEIAGKEIIPNLDNQ